jgi:predicted Rossmann-fold nucleotide-binding protein
LPGRHRWAVERAEHFLAFAGGVGALICYRRYTD